MTKKLPIFYSALLLTGVNLLLRLVSTSFQVYISGRLGAAGVGLLQLVLSVGSLAMTAGMAGIRTATMYLTAEALGRHRSGNVPGILRTCLAYSLVCSGLLSVALYTLAPWIAAYWIEDPRTLGALRCLAIFLPVVCVCGCMSGYFTAANRIGTLAAVEIGEQCVSMAVTMGALIWWADNDPEKACISVILGSSIGGCFTGFTLLILRLLEPKVQPEKSNTLRPLLKTALPLALADDLKIGINTVENLMVPKRLALYEGVASPLAAFGMVSGMVFPVLMFPAAILFALAELLIPELARCRAAGSTVRIRYLTKRSLRLALLYGCLCGGGMFLLSNILCDWLYGSTEAGQILGLYSMLAPMLYCDAITDAMNKGLGQQQTAVRYNILTAVLDVVGLFFLLPLFGMEGYFASFLISHLVNFILSLNLLTRTSGISIPFYIPTLSIAATLAAVYGAGFVTGVFWQILSYLGLLGSLLVLFRVVSTEDLRWLRGLVAKK